MISQYCFFNNGFTFQYSVCNGSHDLTILYLNISYIAIITVKNVDYHCFICNISKSKAINLWENSVHDSIFTFFFTIYRMVDSEYSMDIYKSVKISIGTVTKNPGILKFIHDCLKT